MSSIGSHSQTLGLQMLALFGKVEEALGGGALLAEECHLKRALMVYGLPYFQFALSGLHLWLKMLSLNSLLWLRAVVPPRPTIIDSLSKQKPK